MTFEEEEELRDRLDYALRRVAMLESECAKAAEAGYADDAEIERLEQRLAVARETNKRLNRRCQSAEAGLTARLTSGPSFGRVLANSAATMYLAERDEARAQLDRAEAGHARDGREWDQEIASFREEVVYLRAKIDHLLKPAVWAKMLEPPPPIIIENSERLRELEEALRRVPDRFAHAPSCDVLSKEAPTRPPCSCGIDALLHPTEPVKSEEGGTK